MSTTLNNPQIGCAIQGTVNGASGPAALVATVADQTSGAFTVGTAAGNADLLYSAAFTVTSGAPLTLDLTSLTDPAGGAIDFAHVLAVKVTNLSTTPGQDMTVGGGSNPFHASMSLLAQANADAATTGPGFAAFGAPNPGLAISGTVKNLRISVAAGTGVAGTVTVLGRST